MCNELFRIIQGGQTKTDEFVRQCVEEICKFYYSKEEKNVEKLGVKNELILMATLGRNAFFQAVFDVLRTSLHRIVINVLAYTLDFR